MYTHKLGGPQLQLDAVSYGEALVHVIIYRERGREYTYIM